MLGLAVLIGITVGVILLSVLAAPLLFAGEAVVVAAIGIVARIVARRPFPIVVAYAGGPGRVVTRVSGPLRSHRAVRLVADALGRGADSVTLPGADPATVQLGRR